MMGFSLSICQLVSSFLLQERHNSFYVFTSQNHRYFKCVSRTRKKVECVVVCFDLGSWTCIRVNTYLL